MRISDWSSDVCSSDLLPAMPPPGAATSREAFAKMMTLYAFELTAERYLNDEWVPIRLRNETWDGWIACEVGRESLKPDREEIWADQLPEWEAAKPRGPGQTGRAACRERRGQYV